LHVEDDAPGASAFLASRCFKSRCSPCRETSPVISLSIPLTKACLGKSTIQDTRFLLETCTLASVFGNGWIDTCRTSSSRWCLLSPSRVRTVTHTCQYVCVKQREIVCLRKHEARTGGSESRKRESSGDKQLLSKTLGNVSICLDYLAPRPLLERPSIEHAPLFLHQLQPQLYLRLPFLLFHRTATAAPSATAAAA
jgi:hypothetical protein